VSDFSGFAFSPVREVQLAQAFPLLAREFRYLMALHSAKFKLGAFKLSPATQLEARIGGRQSTIPACRQGGKRSFASFRDAESEGHVRPSQHNGWMTGWMTTL
jgi:hypothetical protein